MPSQSVKMGAGDYIVLLALSVMVAFMVVVSIAMSKINRTKEPARDAQAIGRTIEVNPEPGVLVYVNGRKCQ